MLSRIHYSCVRKAKLAHIIGVKLNHTYMQSKNSCIQEMIRLSNKQMLSSSKLFHS
jgi:hypothetical protein